MQTVDEGNLGSLGWDNPRFPHVPHPVRETLQVGLRGKGVSVVCLPCAGQHSIEKKIPRLGTDLVTVGDFRSKREMLIILCTCPNSIREMAPLRDYYVKTSFGYGHHVPPFLHGYGTRRDSAKGEEPEVKSQQSGYH